MAIWVNKMLNLITSCMQMYKVHVRIASFKLKLLVFIGFFEKMWSQELARPPLPFFQSYYTDVGCEIDMKNKCSTDTIFAVFILLIKLVFSLFVLKSLILI